jgi:hypothetical protein
VALVRTELAGSTGLMRSGYWLRRYCIFFHAVKYIVNALKNRGDKVFVVFDVELFYRLIRLELVDDYRIFDT